MKVFLIAPLLASLVLSAAAACNASDRPMLTDRSSWGDLASFAEPTDECPGGSLEGLRMRMGVTGPYTLQQLEQLEADADAKDRAAGPTTSVVWLYPVSTFIKDNLEQADQLYTFDFMTDPGKSPWWGFRGVVVVHHGCLIHAEVTGYDHG